MVKALRFLAAVGLLGVSVWASAPGAAQATATCEDLQMTHCASGTLYCTFSTGEAGVCHCISHKWFCSPLVPPAG